MKKNLRLGVENIDILLRQLHDFHQTLCQEWANVASQWDNLKSTWFDQQFDQFEQLSANYYEEIEQCEKFLKNKIGSGEVGEPHRVEKPTR
ncbi:hypothetical protein [Geminocystis sp.]|uniref:hypothetical protein n=1 Tax=Geminocystis sp. TaxID=2664100 RepID=UPI0035948873